MEEIYHLAILVNAQLTLSSRFWVALYESGSSSSEPRQYGRTCNPD